MSILRPHKVFVQSIGPTFSFASEIRAHQRAQTLITSGGYAEVLVYESGIETWHTPIEEMTRTVYRHDRPLAFQRLSKQAPGIERGSTALGWVPVDLDRALRYEADGAVWSDDVRVPEPVYQALPHGRAVDPFTGAVVS